MLEVRHVIVNFLFDFVGSVLFPASFVEKSKRIVVVVPYLTRYLDNNCC